MKNYALLCAVVFLVSGCHYFFPSGDTVPLAWGSLDRTGGVIAVTELYGPSYARIDSVLPGTYIVKGTFDPSKLVVPSGVTTNYFQIAIAFEGGNKESVNLVENLKTRQFLKYDAPGAFETSVELKGGSASTRLCVLVVAGKRSGESILEAPILEKVRIR